MLVIKRSCVVCSKQLVVRVPKEGYDQWINGLSIQKAMPHVSDSDREVLLSGICSECFDKIFAEERYE